MHTCVQRDSTLCARIVELSSAVAKTPWGYIRVTLVVENISEPVHEISNSVVCATSKASDQPAHMRSLIRAFASRLSIL